MINWNKLADDTMSKLVLIGFASKALSGRQLYDWHRNTVSGGEARQLLHSRGVTSARQLARKALRRRGVDIHV